MQEIPFLLDSFQYFFIFHTIGPTDQLHPVRAPHFKTFEVFLIPFPKCPSFGTKLQMLHLTNFSLKLKSNFLAKRFFFLLNAAFNMTILDLISVYILLFW